MNIYEMGMGNIVLATLWSVLLCFRH